MKIADVVVEITEKDIHPSLDNKIIVPKLDHDSTDGKISFDKRD